MSHDLCFLSPISCTLVHWCKTSLLSLPGGGRHTKVAAWLKSIVGNQLYSQRYLTCELSFLICLTCEVKGVVFKRFRVLARSPINPWNIEQVPWPWNNNISICQVTRSLSCVWVGNRPRVALVTRKNQTCSKQDLLFHKNA